MCKCFVKRIYQPAFARSLSPGLRGRQQNVFSSGEMRKVVKRRKIFLGFRMKTFPSPALPVLFRVVPLPSRGVGEGEVNVTPSREATQPILED